MKKLIALSAVFLVGTALSSQSAMVGYWNFDDGSANDSSGNANNGTFQNGASATANVANATAGTMSLSVSGGSQHVLVPHDPSLSLSTEITITAWVNPVGSNWGGILAKSPSDGGGANHSGNYELRLQNNAGQNFQWLYEAGPGVNSTITLAGGVGPAIGQWSHIALTHDSAGNFSLYINGVQTSTAVAGTAFGQLTNSNPLYLGSRADLFTTFNGHLDEISIWDEALSPQQIADIHANGVIPEPATSLLGFLGVLGLAARRRR